jgi:hypothetical protein
MFVTDYDPTIGMKLILIIVTKVHLIIYICVMFFKQFVEDSYIQHCEVDGILCVLDGKKVKFINT